MENERYPYWPMSERPVIRWPKDAKLNRASMADEQAWEMQLGMGFSLECERISA